MIHGKSKDLGFRRQIFNRFFLSYLLLKLLGIPQPWHLATCPKVSTESPTQEFGTFEQALGRQFAAPSLLQHETEWSLRKHQEQSASSTSFLYPHEFMKTHEVHSIHSIEHFPENTNCILDPWTLSGLTHFFQNPSSRNLSFSTIRIGVTVLIQEGAKVQLLSVEKLKGKKCMQSLWNSRTKQQVSGSAVTPFWV